ncbi:hypothetical protein GF314_10500 [bacterium]|nr:hypothetical protein [bacterium]
MNRMRPILVVLAALAGSVMLAGCVQLHSETTIDEDGGGTALITISMSEAVADAVKEMEALDVEGGPSGDMPSFGDIEREKIESRVAEYGVEITTFERGMVDGRETIEIGYEFEDMRGLSAAMSAVMDDGGDGNDNGLGIFDAGDGNLVLRPTSYEFPAWEDDTAAEDEAESTAPTQMDPEAMQKQMEIMGKLMGAISELDISMKITVPGDIVSTNAPTQEGRTSIWTINSSNMMSAEQDMEPRIVFEGKGLKIEPQAE